jgi:hypothetical protein
MPKVLMDFIVEYHIGRVALSHQCYNNIYFE